MQPPLPPSAYPQQSYKAMPAHPGGQVHLNGYPYEQQAASNQNGFAPPPMQTNLQQQLPYVDNTKQMPINQQRFMQPGAPSNAQRLVTPSSSMPGYGNQLQHGVNDALPMPPRLPSDQQFKNIPPRPQMVPSTSMPPTSSTFNQQPSAPSHQPYNQHSRSQVNAVPTPPVPVGDQRPLSSTPLSHYTPGPTVSSMPLGLPTGPTIDHTTQQHAPQTGNLSQQQGPLGSQPPNIPRADMPPDPSMFMNAKAPMPPQMQQSGMPLMTGKPPIPGPPTMMPAQMSHQPPMPGQSPITGGHPPIPGQISGQPPMPGQTTGGQPPIPGQMPPPMAGMPGQPGACGPPQQRQRLDPNMMPSPVQVMEDDRQARAGEFHTGYPQADQPPLVTSDVLENDTGNCTSNYMRMTVYAAPNEASLLKNSEMPFSLHVTPLAKRIPPQHSLPLVNLGALGPVRCQRCKAYMCSFMQFTDGGRRFRCPFCTAHSAVPDEYFAHLDHQGVRTDIQYRPELCYGSFEYVATAAYCKNSMKPKPPAYIFMLDVSYNSMRSGVVQTFCHNVRNLLKDIPKEEGEDGTMETARVAFVCYDNELHFYTLNVTLAQATRLTVSDLQDVFVPDVDTFFVRADEAQSAIDTLLDEIPNMYKDTHITETILGPIIEAGLDALKASDRAGKLIIMHSGLPNNEQAPGKLKNRDDRKLLGTEKEKTVLTEQGDYYSKLAERCVEVGCSVDLFLFPNAYCDIASIGLTALITGGQTFKYQYFDPEKDSERFINDLAHDLRRETAFDAMMRVRTSTGIRPVGFYGNIYMQNTTDIELASIDADKCVSIDIKHDDKLETQPAYFQAALLYTSVSGQRRLRIHNLSLINANDFAQMYRTSDIDAVTLMLLKESERMQRDKTPKDVREWLTSRCAQILAKYREKCSENAPAGQLILPEGLKLLPCYVNCILKHDSLAGASDMSTDDRAWLMQMVPSLRPSESVFMLYPRIINLMQVPDSILEDQFHEMPMLTRASYDFLAPDNIYLLENTVMLFIWIGSQLSDAWAQNAFGANNAMQINTEKNTLPEKDTRESRLLRKTIEFMHRNRPRHMKILLIRQGDKLEPWFRKYLVEDKSSVSNNQSYVDYLCHIHREIRNMLSL